MLESRLKAFQELLEPQVVDLNRLRNVCLLGCPEANKIRPLVWKLLLNYLPPHKSSWRTTLSRARAEYEGFLVEFVANKPHTDKIEDHPLNSDPGSNWREYFDDNRVLLQINKDCRRLYPELDFFRRPTQYPCNEVFSANVDVSDLRNRIETELIRSHAVVANAVGALKLVNSGDSINDAESLFRAACDESLVKDESTATRAMESDKLHTHLEAHWEVVQRIIFTFYKTNKGASYVQGMNEVAGPIYYVFANHPDPEERRFAEADTFFCFNNLMAEIQSVFNRNFDQDFGIGGKMEQMMRLLGTFDPELLRYLNRLHLEATHFAFRWITLLLAREFLLPDVLRLWDCILADKHRFDLVLYVCCSMLMLVRKELLACDFAQAVRLLQNYPYTDIGCIISHALGLYNHDNKV